MLKVRFKVSKAYDIRVLRQFVGSRNWSKVIYQHHPGLRNLVDCYSKEEAVRVYVEGYHQKSSELLQEKKGLIMRSWGKICAEYERVLLDIFEIDRFDFSAVCYVSICPVNPRFLKERVFSVYFKDRYPLEILAHEVQHFYFFRKWKMVFPKQDARTFESPHKVWHLSEILASVFLSLDNVQKLIKVKPRHYSKYDKFHVKGLDIVSYFGKLYLQSVKHRKSFSEFLKKSYKVVLKIDFLI